MYTATGSSIVSRSHKRSDIGQVEAGAGQAVGGQLVEQEIGPPRHGRRHAPPDRRVGPEDLDERQAVRVRLLGPGPEPVSHRGLLAGRQRPKEVTDGADQMRQAVVELVKALHVVHDPLVGPQRAGHERLRGTLVHLDQPPVAQRPLRRQGVPGRLRQDAERKGKRGLASPDLSRGGCAASRHRRVELHRRAQQQGKALEAGQAEPVTEQLERWRRARPPRPSRNPPTRRRPPGRRLRRPGPRQPATQPLKAGGEIGSVTRLPPGKGRHDSTSR